MYIFRTFTGPGHFHLPYKVYITFLHNSTFPFLTPPYAILTPPYKILTPLTGGRTAKIELYQFGSLDIAKREDITDIKEMLEYDLKESAEALPKAISRFARNTVTLLRIARELKEIGVDVYFEEQNIHKISDDGELMLCSCRRHQGSKGLLYLDQ